MRDFPASVPRLSRGRVLASLAAAGAAAALPHRAIAQAANRPWVDVHHHYFPPPLMTAMNAWQAKHKLAPIGRPVAGWSPARSVEEMDRTGIRTAILSLASTKNVWFDVPKNQIAGLSRACNDYAAGMMRDYPGRFGLFASLPMPDVDASLKEIAYALDTLKADGIGLPTSFGDTWPGDPEFAPVWQELDRRGTMVMFHPYAPNCCMNIPRYVPESYIEYPYDTGRAALSLLFSGSLVRYRNVKWAFSHGGGAIPYLAGRIVNQSRTQTRELAQVAPNGVDAELKRLYYETANAAYKPTMDGLLDYVPLSQIMFGTDYPYLTGVQNRDGLEALKLPAATLAAIQYQNAQRLLPRLRA